MKTKTPRKTETEYEFNLVLTGPEELLDLPESIMDAFFEAAGGDLTPGVSCGVPYVGCTRSAPTMKDAILSAIADVRKVGRGIDVVRVEWPSLMTQAELARRIGKTRQAVNQYAKGLCGPSGFPPPARKGDQGQPLWQWCDVAQWLFNNGMAPERLHLDAQAVDTINCVLDYTWKSKHHAARVREVEAAVAGKKTA
jgi:hypothetical protein